MEQEDLIYYGEYAPLLIEKHAMLLEEVERIITGLTPADPEHAPVEHLRSRIKSSQSLRSKQAKQGFPEDAQSGLINLMDIIGIRIITHFVGDVYLLLQQLQQSDVWTVVLIKDYIARPKPNGYRSLHVIIEFPVSDPRLQTIKAEIQLRTIAMDCWASLEHQLKYKKNIRNTTLLVGELKRCADEMASTDLSMQTIRDMIEGEI